MKLQGNLIKPVPCVRARPNFWGAFQSAANFLVRAVTVLCRLDAMLHLLIISFLLMVLDCAYCA